MAGAVIVDMADVASNVSVGVVVTCFVSELISYYLKKQISMQKKKKKKKPHMGMASIVIDSVGGVTTIIVIIGVIMACFVNSLLSYYF